MKGSGLLPLLFPVFLRKWFPGSPAHKQFFHPAPEACGNPGVPGQHAVGGSAAWGFPASICVFEAKKSPDMRIWRFLVSMFFTDKSNPLRIRPLP